jgi:hypothetical protein
MAFSFGYLRNVSSKLMNLYSANGITLLAKKRLILSNKINTVKLLIALCKEIPEDIAAIHFSAN